MRPSNKQAAARDAYEEYRMRTKMFSVGELMDMRASFQRPLQVSAVRKIVREWNIDLWEMPVVGQLPDGTFVLNEGQHRLNAAAIVMGEDAKVECRIVVTSNPGQLFASLNTSKRRVRALDILLAEATDEGSEAAKALVMAKSHGFSIARGRGVRTIQSAHTFMNLYRQDPAALSVVLNILDSIMKLRNNETGWTKGNVLITLHVLMRTAVPERGELVKRLARGNAELAVPYGPGDIKRNLDSVVSVYNYGRQDKNRLDAGQLYQAYRELQLRTKYPQRSAQPALSELPTAPELPDQPELPEQ